MSKRNCCIKDCNSSGYHLNKWKKQFCNIHNCNFGTSRCICDPPYTLYPFPTERSDPEGRQVWIKNVNRTLGGKIWIPSEDSRICSKHFVDQQPTVFNPHPTLNLGYTLNTPASRLPPLDRSHIDPTPTKKRKSVSDKTTGYDSNSINDHGNHDCCDHNYLATCIGCDLKNKEISTLKNKIRVLEQELILQKSVTNRNLTTNIVLKNDKNIKFYTGIPSVQAFNALYKIIEPQAMKARYWRGSKHCVAHVLKHKQFNANKTGKKRATSCKQEMLMTLMKLRLGLLNEDIAHRFNISASQVSKIFATWIKILSKFLGSLVFNPPKEVVRENLPPCFQTPKYSSVRHIIDCTEVFLEKAQNLEVQTKCWSDYKHHQTAKFLISINPSGLINFISKCWGGRTSDKYITAHSGFYDILEPFDTVMADRGFQILEEVTLHQARLLIPPGRRGACQMSGAEVTKTKEIANRRIYIEQAIRRLKCFRILKFELPATLFQYLDDILSTVSGICNLYPPLPKYN